MKKIYLPQIVWWILLIATGCNDDNEVFFQGEPSLHFALTSSKLDSMYFSFTTNLENHFQVNLPVEIAGYSDMDRTFRLRIDEEHTTAIPGKHYNTLEDTYTFKKGVYQLNIPLVLNYTPDMDSIAFRLVLDIDPMDHFIPGIPYRQRVIIVCSNLLPPISAHDWEVYYLYEFGPYSKVKHRYIMSELKINELGRGRFEDHEEWWQNFSWDEHKIYSYYMNSFFATHEIYDENGKRILPWLD